MVWWFSGVCREVTILLCFVLMRLAFWWFGVCPLSDFSNSISDGVLVAWLSVVSRTCLLFFRSCRALVISPSFSFEGVLLAAF